MKKLIYFLLIVVFAAKSAAPPTPGGFAISGKTHNSISIKWNAVATATNFEVQIAEGSGSYLPVILLKSTDLAYTFNNLKSSTTYKVRVIATNKDGKSTPAETKDITSPAPLPLPGVPTNLNSSATISQITFSWESGGGGQQDSFTWQCSGASNFSNIVASGTGAAKSATINGLASNTPYYLRVLATNKTGSSAYSATRQHNTLNPVLPVPSNFRVLNFDANNVNLGWNTVSGAESYQIRYSNNNFSSVIATVSAKPDETSKGFGALSPNTSYAFQIRTMNTVEGKEYPSGWSSSVVQQTAALPKIGVPINFSLGGATSNQLVFNWQSSSENVVGEEFDWQCSLDANFGSAGLLSGNTTAKTATVSNLQAGSTYYFRALAKTKTLNSGFSKTFSGKTLDPTVPIPNNFRVSSSFETIMDAIWDAVPNASGYEVRIAENANFSPIVETKSLGNIANYKFLNLKANTAYFSQVRAKQSINGKDFWSAWSATANKNTPLFGGPKNLSTQNIGTNQITYKWQSGSIGLGTEYFLWELSEKSDFSTFKKTSNGLIQYLEITISDLDPNKTYFFRVRNSIQSRLGNWISIESKTLNVAPPAAPTNVMAVQQDFNAAGNPVVKISWTSNWPTSIMKEIFRSENATTGFVSIAPSNDIGNFEFDSPTCGKTYYYKVQEGNSGNLIKTELSAASNAIAVACKNTDLKAPSDLVATTVSSTQINLKWVDNEQNEEFYAYEYSIDQNTWKSEGLPKDANSVEVKNLDPSTKYFFRVRATRQNPPVKYSGYSNVANATTQAPPLTRPATPTNFSASTASSSQINLTWSDVATESEFELDRSVDGSNFSKIITLSANITTYQNTGLEATKQYYYRLRAINGAGQSDFTATVNATTQAPPLTNPATPTNFTATASSSTQINLSWTDVASETEYELERSIDGSNFSKLITLSANITTFQNTGLEASKKYYYRLRAINGAGQSDYSAIVNATTQAPPLAKPSAPLKLHIVNITTNSVSLTWDDVRFEDSYLLERSDNNTNNFRMIKELNSDVTTFTDISLIPSTTYYFRVKSKNKVGESGFSNVVSAITTSNLIKAPINLKVDQTIIKPNQIDLTWDNQGNDASKIEIYRAIENEDNWVLYKTLNKTNGVLPNKFNDDKVRTIYAYLYKVRKLEDSKITDWSNTLFANAPLVNSLINEGNINIYPNPSSNFISIKNRDLSNVRIFNNHGRNVSISCTISKEKIDISQLPSGTYFLNLDNTHNYKFIKL